MVMSNHFQEKLKQGHEQGELPIEQILHQYDWYTFPTYHYRSEQHKSPGLKNYNDIYISPDIDASKNGKRIWVECKLEEGASWTWSKERFEHGFALKYYEQYLKVQEITGCPVWIFFLEYDQNSRTEKDFFECVNKGRKLLPVVIYPKNMLRGQLLSKLSIRKSKFNGKDYVYFPWDNFYYFGEVNGILLPTEIETTDITPFDILERI